MFTVHCYFIANGSVLPKVRLMLDVITHK